MRRRRLLQTTATATTLGLLAGCTESGDRGTDEPTEDGGGPGAGPDDGSEDHNGDDHNGDDQPPEGGSELVNTEFTVTGREGGTRTDQASIDFDEDAGQVTVTGTITGSDMCHTAALEAADHDTDAGRLSVAVVTVDESEEGEMCAQSLVEIDYEAVFTFDGAIPTEVGVSHDGRAVTGAGYGSDSATASDG
jgi:hypothetical protein